MNRKSDEPGRSARRNGHYVMSLLHLLSTKARSLSNARHSAWDPMHIVTSCGHKQQNSQLKIFCERFGVCPNSRRWMGHPRGSPVWDRNQGFSWSTFIYQSIRRSKPMKGNTFFVGNDIKRKATSREPEEPWKPSSWEQRLLLVKATGIRRHRV